MIYALLEDGHLGVVDSAIYVEEVHHAVEDVVLSRLVKFFYRSVVRTPDDKRNLDLLAWCHSHRHTVHIEVVLAQALAVVRDKHHTTTAAINALERIYYRAYKVVGVEDSIVVGVVQLLRYSTCHLNGCAYRCKVLKFSRILGVVCWAVAGAAV